MIITANFRGIAIIYPVSSAIANKSPAKIDPGGHVIGQYSLSQGVRLPAASV